jgi:ankyrin repeat protein
VRAAVHLFASSLIDTGIVRGVTSAAESQFLDGYQGDVATVRAWLDGSGGGDPSTRRGWDGSTLLHCAADALCDNVALVELLIEAGVSIDGRNDDGATALLCAAMAEHRGVVALLLAAGADPLIEDNEGQCAAAQEGFVASYS